MYNLLISLGVALLAFALGALAGRWAYGLAPAFIVFPVVYFVLSRRTGRQVEAILKQAMAALQARRVDEGKALLRSALPLGRWQFLVAQQIYTQLGALEYMQQNYAEARPLLEKGWSRNWQSALLLAVLDARAGEGDAAVARLDKAGTFASKEPLYWGVGARVLVEVGRTEAALQWLARGVEALPDHAGLKELRTAVANDRVNRFKWARTFGQGWYQFFPGELPGAAPAREHLARAGYQRGGRTYPAPRGQRR